MQRIQPFFSHTCQPDPPLSDVSIPQSNAARNVLLYAFIKNSETTFRVEHGLNNAAILQASD